jgi:hypothetical protein
VFFSDTSPENTDMLEARRELSREILQIQKLLMRFWYPKNIEVLLA